MPKFYVISDVHGNYTAMKKALDETGFNPDDENSWLISLGDEFDRFDENAKVLSYLRRLPRAIILKGNHIDLLEECCKRGYPLSHDLSNGTAETICELGDMDEGYTFDECCDRTLSRIHLYTDNMLDYFETKSFVFTHGFLAVNCDDNLPAHYQRNRKFSKMENWREATPKQWSDARWLNGMQMVHDGFDIDKCIVVGHWHTSWGRAQFEGESEFGPDADFSPYYYEDKLIAIDSCVAYTGKINCLVIEDDFLEDAANE